MLALSANSVARACKRVGMALCITMVRVGWSQLPCSPSSIIILLTIPCTCKGRATMIDTKSVKVLSQDETRVPATTHNQYACTQAWIA